VLKKEVMGEQTKDGATSSWALASKPGRFRSPTGVVIGPEEQVYVVDAGNLRVQVFDQAALPIQGEAGTRW
jgi:hypothetical protein